MFGSGTASLERQSTASVADSARKPEVLSLPLALERHRDRQRRSEAADRSDTSSSVCRTRVGNDRRRRRSFRSVVMATLLFCLVTANWPSASGHSSRRRGPPPSIAVDSSSRWTLSTGGKTFSRGLDDDVSAEYVAGGNGVRSSSSRGTESSITDRVNDIVVVDASDSDSVWTSRSSNAVGHPIRHYRHGGNRHQRRSQAGNNEESEYELQMMADQPRDVVDRVDDEHSVVVDHSAVKDDDASTIEANIPPLILLPLTAEQRQLAYDEANGQRRNFYRALIVNGTSLSDDVIDCVIKADRRGLFKQSLSRCVRNVASAEREDDSRACDESFPHRGRCARHRRSHQNAKSSDHDHVTERPDKFIRETEVKANLTEVRAHFFDVQNITESVLCSPQPVVKRVGNSSVQYHPKYTIVYECPTVDACSEVGHNCIKTKSDVIKRLFSTVHDSSDYIPFEYMTFENHTECGCSSTPSVVVQQRPQQQQQQQQQQNELVTSSLPSSTCIYCPSPFKLRNNHARQPYCHCEGKSRTCNRIAKGTKSLEEVVRKKCEEDENCMIAGICKKGLHLNLKTGKCEPLESKSSSVTRQPTTTTMTTTVRPKRAPRQHHRQRHHQQSGQRSTDTK